jgi:hypothetical protein
MATVHVGPGGDKFADVFERTARVASLAKQLCIEVPPHPMLSTASW